MMCLPFKMSSLISLHGLRWKRESLSYTFIEYVMSTPFDDNVLGMKMSVQLYMREEYSKLY